MRGKGQHQVPTRYWLMVPAGPACPCQRLLVVENWSSDLSCLGALGSSDVGPRTLKFKSQADCLPRRLGVCVSEVMGAGPSFDECVRSFEPKACSVAGTLPPGADGAEKEDPRPSPLLSLALGLDEMQSAD